MLKIILSSLLILTSTCSAYESAAYYVTHDKFSIDGYDFITEDRPFPIIQGELYDVSEEDQENLPGDGFRKSIRISTLDGKSSSTFTTRVINNTKKATIIEVQEISKSIYQDIADYGPPYWVLKASYNITLEDGEILQISLWKTEEDYGTNYRTLEKYIFLPCDQIEIRAEIKRNSNFSDTEFFIYLNRDGKRIGSYSYTAISREDNLHGQHENLYVIDQILKHNNGSWPAKFEVNFFGHEGIWEMVVGPTASRPGPSSPWQEPFPGRQFELIGQPSFEKLQLKMVNTNEIVEFRRVEDKKPSWWDINKPSWWPFAQKL